MEEKCTKSLLKFMGGGGGNHRYARLCLFWEVVNGVGVDGVGGIFPIFFVFSVFSSLFRFSLFFFVFSPSLLGKEQTTAIYWDNGEFHSDPICTDPVRNFLIIFQEDHMDQDWRIFLKTCPCACSAGTSDESRQPQLTTNSHGREIGKIANYHSLRIYPYPMVRPLPRPWSETMVSIPLWAQKTLEIKGFLGLERPFLDLVSQTPRPRGRGRPLFAETKRPSSDTFHIARYFQR